MDIPSTIEDQYSESEIEHDEVVGGNTTSHGTAELGEIVGGNTTEPTETDMEVNLMEKLELGSRDEKEERRHDIHLVYIPEEMNRADSPATSTPSSTPSPRRYREREGGLEGLGTEDSEMSDIVDSSVADTKEPEDKRGANIEDLLDGKSKKSSQRRRGKVKKRSPNLVSHREQGPELERKERQKYQHLKRKEIHS